MERMLPESQQSAIAAEQLRRESAALKNMAESGDDDGALATEVTAVDAERAQAERNKEDAELAEAMLGDIAAKYEGVLSLLEGKHVKEEVARYIKTVKGIGLKDEARNIGNRGARSTGPETSLYTWLSDANTRGNYYEPDNFWASTDASSPGYEHDKELLEKMGESVKADWQKIRELIDY